MAKLSPTRPSPPPVLEVDGEGALEEGLASTIPATLDMNEPPSSTSPRSGSASPTSKRVSTGRSKELFEHHKRISQKHDEARDTSIARAGYTFQPCLSARQRPERTFEGDLFSHLHEDGERRREKLMQKQSEADASAGTFRPDTTATAKSPFAKKAADTAAAAAAAAAPTAAASTGAEASSAAAAAPPSPPSQPRHAMLYEDAKARPERARAAAAEAYRDLTFAPDTAATKRFNSAHLRAHSAMPLVDRLYERDRLAARPAELEARQLQLELQGCTFAPSVRRVSAPSAADSAGGGNGGGRGGEVHRRLFEDAGRIAEARGRRKEEIVAKEGEPCTFQPALVARSRQRAAAGMSVSLSPPRSNGNGGSNSGGGSGGGGVQEAAERLYRMAKEMQARRGDAAAAAGADPECTFRPALSMYNTGVETEQEGNRLDALYRHGKDLQDRRNKSPRDPAAAIRQREEEVELKGACTFTPDTSFTLKSPHRKPDRAGTAELFNDLYAQRDRQEAARADALARAQADCTFAPQLVAVRPAATSPRRTGGASVFDGLYQDAENIQEAHRQAGERLQAEQCTFKPTLVTAAKAHGGGNRGSSTGGGAHSTAMAAAAAAAVLPPPPSKEGDNVAAGSGVLSSPTPPPMATAASGQGA